MFQANINGHQIVIAAHEIIQPVERIYSYMLTCEEDLAHESSWAARASWVSWVRTFVGMASGTRYDTGSGSDLVVSKIVAPRGARSLLLPVPYRWSSFGALNPHLLQTAAERVRMQVEHLGRASLSFNHPVGLRENSEDVLPL
jgi:hypothetical protein